MIINRELIAEPHNWLVIGTMLLIALLIAGLVDPYRCMSA
jgi:hypothetical protein